MLTGFPTAFSFCWRTCLHLFHFNPTSTCLRSRPTQFHQRHIKSSRQVASGPQQSKLNGSTTIRLPPKYSTSTPLSYHHSSSLDSDHISRRPSAPHQPKWGDQPTLLYFLIITRRRWRNDQTTLSTMFDLELAPWHVPKFFHRNARLAYQDLHFNSVPAIDKNSARQRGRRVHALEINFLHHVLRYFDGALNLRRSSNPDQFWKPLLKDSRRQHVVFDSPSWQVVRAPGKDFPESVLGSSCQPFSGQLLSTRTERSDYRRRRAVVYRCW